MTAEVLLVELTTAEVMTALVTLGLAKLPIDGLDLATSVEDREILNVAFFDNVDSIATLDTENHS